MQTVIRTINRLDPRYYQIGVLTSLVLYGVTALDFGIHWYNAVAILLTAQAVQFVGSVRTGIRFDPLSAMITALSLTLLLRTGSVVLAACAALIAIGSKFIIRVNGKHVFNPANVAIVALMLTTDAAWISTGQWGNAAISALALACLGLLVLTRAKRAETTIAFLAVYAALLLVRTVWLSDPFAIALHHLQNGALLIFAFFMISDPKTTPDTPTGRVLFAAIVAVAVIGEGLVLAMVIATGTQMNALCGFCVAVTETDQVLCVELRRMMSFDEPLARQLFEQK